MCGIFHFLLVLFRLNEFIVLIISKNCRNNIFTFKLKISFSSTFMKHFQYEIQAYFHLKECILISNIKNLHLRFIFSVLK